jgi:hypothetical protein
MRKFYKGNLLSISMAEETTPTPQEEPKELSDLEKLKAANLEMENELIKSRELKAESMKIESEKILSGETGGHVEVEVKEETAKEYADKIMGGAKND